MANEHKTSEKLGNRKAIASVLMGTIGITGIISIFIFPDIPSLFLLVFSLVFIFLALILGFTGRKLARQLDVKNRVRAKKASLVFGILGIISFFSFFLVMRTSIPFFGYLFAFSPVFMLLAVKFGIEAKNQSKQPGVKDRGATRAGLLLGIVGLILLVIFGIFWAIIWSSTS